jgi:predicted kinase
VLIVFGGLPATGKTTIARALSRRIRGIHLRIDTVEQALRSSESLRGDVGATGYQVVHALARDMLQAGQTVIIDAVNPVEAARIAWRQLAAETKVPIVEIEVIRSDPADHRRHAESRVADIAGMVLPTWADIQNRQYEPWTEPHVIIDASGRTVDESAAEAVAALQIY